MTDATPTDTAMRRFAGYEMKRASAAMQAGMNDALAPMDLRLSIVSALALIGAHPGVR